MSYIARYMKERAALLKSLGVCRDCGKNPCKRTSVLCRQCTNNRITSARRRKHANEVSDQH